VTQTTPQRCRESPIIIITHEGPIRSLQEGKKTRKRVEHQGAALRRKPGRKYGEEENERGTEICQTKPLTGQPKGKGPSDKVGKGRGSAGSVCLAIFVSGRPDEKIGAI